MITKDYLNELVIKRLNEAKQPDSHYGSLPQSLFNKNGEFNVHNWNGGDSIIRQFTHYLEWSNGKTYCKDFDLALDRREFSGEIISSYAYFDDDNYVQITVRWYEWLDSETCGNTTVDQYLIQYYKSRGCTDLVMKNGKLIKVDEYVRLLQIIEASGYEFSK